MKLMYLDESGSTGTDYDNKQQPIFVLGGLTVEDKNWHKINNFFENGKIKISSYFKNNEIHTSEIFSPSHKSVFHIKNWEENLKILDNLVSLISKLELSFNFIAIDKKYFKMFLQKNVCSFIKVDPYIYAFCMFYHFTSETLSKNKEKGIIFLDEIFSIPEYLKKIYPEISTDNTSIIEQALFLKSKDTNFIQIADIYSFYVCQYLNIKKGYKKYSDLKRSHCINNYTKLLEKTNMANTEFLTKNFPKIYIK